MAIPSLSYEPATDRLIYPGTIAINPAANSPAPGDHISFVRKYVAIAVRPLYKQTDKQTITHNNKIL